MIPFVGAGRIGVSMLRTLYKGKKKIGKMTKMTADYAAKKGHPGIAKGLYGASQKAHKGSRATGKWIKKNPKVSSAITGAVIWDILDND